MSLMEQAKRGLSSMARLIGSTPRTASAAPAASPDLDAFVGRLKLWAQHHPEPIFAMLREVDPIAIVKHVAVVTRFDDAHEVLARDDIFQVPYADKFARLADGRRFVLGMSNTAEYERDTATLRMVMRREDIAQRVIPFVSRCAEDIVARGRGRLDIVKELGDIVPSALVGDYLGTPSPQPRQFAQQSAAMSGFLFLPLASTPEVERQALAAASDMRRVLREYVQARKQSRGAKEDVLERLLVLQDAGFSGLSDDDILDKLFGVVVAIIPTTCAAVARALDELFRRPDQLARAQSAARIDDYAAVYQFIQEALRFNPLGPGVFRVAASDYVLARATMRARAIPTGTLVLAALESAMLDDHFIESPRDFRVDRPAWQYMHFGYGLHTCFGHYISAAQLPRILLPLLKRSNLRRAAGPAGELAFEGPFPASLVVEYDA